ncbi:hypothetical protein ElyMa_000047600 [Elysia marginata]|uniref:Secreted protein n=1 Tax=Elysia marginata TaxID=1093978 RepID=A0AAV4EDN9_9GAST|nr:hypothetical protein ElyMa_000047600 [Elysia marginata]
MIMIMMMMMMMIIMIMIIIIIIITNINQYYHYCHQLPFQFVIQLSFSIVRTEDSFDRNAIHSCSVIAKVLKTKTRLHQHSKYTLMKMSTPTTAKVFTDSYCLRSRKACSLH